MHGESRHVLAEEADAPGRRRKIAGDGVEQRRLACAVGAEHRPPLAGANPKVDVGERDERAELTAHALELQREARSSRRGVRRRLWSTMAASVSAAHDGSLAVRIVAIGDAELEEVRLGNPERLVDRRDDLHDLVVEMAVVGLGDLGQIIVGDRLAVLVELDLAGRRVELELGERVAELRLIVRQIAA